MFTQNGNTTNVLSHYFLLYYISFLLSFFINIFIHVFVFIIDTACAPASHLKALRCCLPLKQWDARICLL